MAQVDLGSSLTIAEVGEMKAALKVALESGESLLIRADDLQQVDGAGVQLLVAWLREAKSRDLRVGWSGTSTGIADAAKLLGLEWSLGLDAA